MKTFDLLAYGYGNEAAHAVKISQVVKMSFSIYFCFNILIYIEMRYSNKVISVWWMFISSRPYQ